MGPALNRRDHGGDILLRRVETFLATAIGRIFSGGDATETLALARLACDVPPDDPRADVWTPISSVNAPAPRLFFASGWDSRNLFIWGGVNSRFQPLPDGKLYDTSTGVWKTVSRNNAPTPRLGPTVVWSGQEFIVWGGSDVDGNPIGTGAKYNPAHNVWTTITTVGAPAARSNQTAIWNGSRMIIWGGSGPCCNMWFNDGFAYTP